MSLNDTILKYTKGKTKRTLLTTNISEVSSVPVFRPNLSTKSPTSIPQKIGGKKVTEAIQDIVSSEIGSGAGPSFAWRICVIGDCQPISMPKFSTGMVTVEEILVN